MVIMMSYNHMLMIRNVLLIIIDHHQVQGRVDILTLLSFYEELEKFLFDEDDSKEPDPPFLLMTTTALLILLRQLSPGLMRTYKT